MRALALALLLGAALTSCGVHPHGSTDAGLVGEATAWAPMAPHAQDGNVQLEVWHLYFDFEARYGTVIDELQSVFGVEDRNDSTESIIEDACASLPRAGAVTDELAAAITHDVGPILQRQRLDVSTLLDDITTYHQQVIALGVCA